MPTYCAKCLKKTKGCLKQIKQKNFGHVKTIENLSKIAIKKSKFNMNDQMLKRH